MKRRLTGKEMWFYKRMQRIPSKWKQKKILIVGIRKIRVEIPWTYNEEIKVGKFSTRKTYCR